LSENRKQGRRRRGGRKSKRRETPDVPPVSPETRATLDKTLEEGHYIVFDLETTGGNPEKNGITEIFALRFRGGEPKETFYSLVNPGIPIPPIVRRMTGINNQMVRGAPRIEEVMPGFIEFVGRDIFVSHNTIGDMKFVRYFAKQACGVELDNFYLCTHLLVEKLAHEAPDKSLKGLAEYFKLAKGEFHRAEGDTYVTLELFKVLLERLKARSVKRIDEAVRLQGDLESGMRLGWGVPPEALKSLPQGPGVFHVFDHEGRLAFLSSAMNVERDVHRLSTFDQLPRQLLRLVLRAYDIKGSRSPNPFSAMLQECDDLQKHSVQVEPALWHQRTIQTLHLSEDQHGIKLGIGNMEAGMKHAFGPVRDRRIAGELLDQIAKAFGAKTQRDSLQLPRDKEPLILALFQGKIEGMMKEVAKAHRSIKLWFQPAQRKALGEQLKVLKSLAAIRLPARFGPLLDRSGLLVLPDGAGGWQVHSIVASRPRGLTGFKGDPETKLRQGGFAAKLAEKVRHDLETLEPAPLTAHEVARINATLWWLYNGKGEGKFLTLEEIESPSAPEPRHDQHARV
jgi:DNA polymerase III epsilon subunit-like protein